MRTELFQLQNDSLTRVAISQFDSEKKLQRLIENNLNAVFNFRLVASEFSTGERHAGRIDTLALDQNDNPVIIEYKNVESSDLINQSLFYRHWLQDHHGDFQLAVSNSLGDSTRVNWSDIRVICISPNYRKYDLLGVTQIGAFIELWSFRLYANNTLYLKEVYSNRLSNQSDASACSANKSVSFPPVRSNAATSSFNSESVAHTDSELRSSLREAASASGELDSPSLARIFGVSANWFTQRVRRSGGSPRPTLQPKKLGGDIELRGRDGRFLYSLQDVLQFIDEFERFVLASEPIDKPIKLVSSLHPKVETQQWITATKATRWPGAPINSNSIRKLLGNPVAFQISSSGSGYSLLFDASTLNQLR
jgi:hypothetical protein